MRKPSKEDLDQAIFDWGYNAALEWYCLTDKQADRILFEQASNERKRLVDKQQIDEEKAQIIWRIISTNYERLRNEYVKNDSRINLQGKTTEDKFHSAIIRIIERLDRFEYQGEKKTLEYVRSRLFFEKRTDNTIDYRDNKKIKLVHNSETILNNISDDYAY